MACSIVPPCARHRAAYSSRREAPTVAATSLSLAAALQSQFQSRAAAADESGHGEVEPAAEAVIETMSLRSLGYLLTRRFKICSRQAEFLPFGPAVATALLGGGLGILIFKRHLDDADNNVTDKDTKEVTDKKPMQVPVTNMEKRDVDMETRFHKWMKRVGRVYPNHEEETRRFEIFKERVKVVEALNDSSVDDPNKFADRTLREILAGHRHSDRSSWDFREYEEEALLRFTQEKMLEGRKARAAQKQ